MLWFSDGENTLEWSASRRRGWDKADVSVKHLLQRRLKLDTHTHTHTHTDTESHTHKFASWSLHSPPFIHTNNGDDVREVGLFPFHKTVSPVLPPKTVDNYFCMAISIVLSPLFTPKLRSSEAKLFMTTTCHPKSYYVLLAIHVYF